MAIGLFFADKIIEAISVQVIQRGIVSHRDFNVKAFLDPAVEVYEVGVDVVEKSFFG